MLTCVVDLRAHVKDSINNKYLLKKKNLTFKKINWYNFRHILAFH